jgi:hypothetical protein
MPEKLYIVLDNFGFPRFADPDMTKLRYFFTEEDANSAAMELAATNPNTVVSVWCMTKRFFDDGLGPDDLDA